MDEIRVSITLKGDHAENFYSLVRAKYENSRYRRGKLLRLAAEAILDSRGTVVFPTQQGTRIRRVKTIEVVETVISQPPCILDKFPSTDAVNEVTEELKKGNSRGAELFKKFKERAESHE